MPKNQHFCQNHIIKMTFYNIDIKLKTYNLLDKLLKWLKIDFERHNMKLYCWISNLNSYNDYIKNYTVIINF